MTTFTYVLNFSGDSVQKKWTGQLPCRVYVILTLNAPPERIDLSVKKLLSLTTHPSHGGKVEEE